MPETSALGEERAPSSGIKWTGASCGETGAAVGVGVPDVVAVGSTFSVGSIGINTGSEADGGGLDSAVDLP